MVTGTALNGSVICRIDFSVALAVYRTVASFMSIVPCAAAAYAVLMRGIRVVGLRHDRGQYDRRLLALSLTGETVMS